MVFGSLHTTNVSQGVKYLYIYIYMYRRYIYIYIYPHKKLFLTSIPQSIPERTHFSRIGDRAEGSKPCSSACRLVSCWFWVRAPSRNAGPSGQINAGECGQRGFQGGCPSCPNNPCGIHRSAQSQCFSGACPHVVRRAPAFFRCLPRQPFREQKSSKNQTGPRPRERHARLKRQTHCKRVSQRAIQQERNRKRFGSVL